MKNRMPLCTCVMVCTGAAIAIGTVGTPAHAQCPDPEMLYSLDIASDSELSDPQADGDEVFDPGDLYVRGMAPAIPSNGFVDDFFYFGLDPIPDPIAGTKAAVCFSPPIPPDGASEETFDLDGTDSLDVDLRQFIPPDVALQNPIPQFPSNCIYDPQHVFISFDDDRALHFVGAAGICEVPVTSPSPFLGAIYGMTVPRDEILAVTLGLGFPAPVITVAPFLDERDLSASLAPNPDNGDPDDDDTDALDAVPGPLADPPCPYVYFSPDHEGHFGLDPGDIYVHFLFGGGPNFAPVIDDEVHLGLPRDTDVDAFEFAWFTGADGTVTLALLFSVDDDDPITTVDESGGLDPTMIYISRFTGSFSPFLTENLGDDIDAIAIYCAAIGDPTGACCLCDGLCIDNITAADCAAQGGIYQGDGTGCAVIQCPPFGACCLPDGTCVDDLTLTECEGPAFGGIYQGDCTDCAGVTCTVACCFCDGFCLDLAPVDCQAQGGTPQGPNTNCANTPCLPYGACCLCDGQCIDGVTQLICEDPLALNGKFQGPCTDCATITCRPYGACCLPDGACVDMISQSVCVNQFNGIYQGDCTNCANVNCDPFSEACCFCDGTCLDLLPSDCVAQGGQPQGAGTTCAGVQCVPYGACCLPDGTCVDGVDASSCIAQGGTYQGDCTDCSMVDCPRPEACCFCDGTCLDLDPADCFAQGGQPQGAGTTCATVQCEPYGACCFCDGFCADFLTEADCLASNGKWLPCVTCAEINCIPFGACCLPDGTCVDMLSQAECTSTAFGGIYQGDCSDCAGVNCLPDEACCFCDGTCLDLPPQDCLAQGGKPQAGLTCAQVDCEPFGACCLPDGTCVDMVTLNECEAAGGLGGTYQGDCTDCANVECPPTLGACCFACEQYPGGPPIGCLDVDRDTCCALQGLFFPGGTCATIACDQRLCPGDLNGDNRTDIFDFGVLAGNFGQCVPQIFGRCDGDLNCDGCIDIFDFGILAGNFGCNLPPVANQCCSGP